MTLKAKVAMGMKWQAINMIGRQLLSLVIFTILARLLDPSAFGLVALASVYLYFVTVLASFGIGVALVQRKILEPAHIDTAFWFNTGFNALLFVSTLMAAGLIARLLGDARLVPIVRWLALALMVTSLSTIPARLLLKDMDFRNPAIGTFIANLTGGLVGIGMALRGAGVWALVGQQLGFAIANTVFMWSVSRYKPTLAFSYRHLRELLAVGSSAFANAIIWCFTSRLDQVIIGRIGGTISLGLYVVANRIPDVLKNVTQQPLTDVAVSAFSSIQDDKAKMRRAIVRGMELNAVVVFPIFIGLALVAHDLVPFLFKEKWASASVLCSLMALYALVNALQIFLYPSLLAVGVTAPYVVLNAATAIGVLAACTIGIHFGVVYVVVGLIVNSLIFIVPYSLLLWRQIGLSPAEYYRPCLAPAMASAAMSVAVLAPKFLLPKLSSHAAPLAISIMVGAIVYIYCLLQFDRTAIKNVIEAVKYAIAKTKLSRSAS